MWQLAAGWKCGYCGSFGVIASEHKYSWNTSIEEHRVIGRILAVILCVLLGSYVGLKAFIVHRVHKLEHMLSDVESLKPGVSSSDEATRIAEKYAAKPSSQGPCSPQNCRLEMHVSWFDPSGAPVSHEDNWVLNRLGIHFWSAGSWIEVHNNVVTSCGAEVGIEGTDSDHIRHEASWSLFPYIPKVDESQEKQFLRNFNPDRDPSPELLVDWTDFNRVENLDARISMRATDRQVRIAEGFNLKCLTTIGDCSSARDLLPEAARYYTAHLSSALKFSQPALRSNH